MKLYLQTLQNRAGRRGQAAGVLPRDAAGQRPPAGDDRAGAARRPARRASCGAPARCRSTSARWCEECLALARTRHHLPPEALTATIRHVDGASFQVLGDEDDLKAMVSNLVDNAIKYSGPEVQVAVELEQADPATATLRVRDQGVGISQSERKRIFKRFYRIPGAMQHARQGHRARPVHRPLGGRAARRQGLRRERRRRARAAPSSSSCRWSAAAHEPHPRRRRRAAPGRRPALQPRGRAVRGRSGRQRRGGAAAADRRAGALRSRDPRRDAARHRRLQRRDRAAARRGSSCRS